MGTRSKTTIYDELNRPLLSFYRQFDGYFEGHGQELQEFLKERKICNGYSLNDSSATKVSNGMSCLAASLIAHFKTDIGGIYICNHASDQEYNYHIRFVGNDEERYGRVTLTGECRFDNETKEFQLYKDQVVAKKEQGYKQIAEFYYDKDDCLRPEWRQVGVYEITDKHIKGLDLNDNNRYKQFSISKIIGGMKKVTLLEA